jgi:glycosyltransferase involved in cell wall biosynthesis
MTRLLVDLLFFTGSKGGMESYVREMYPRIAELRPELELVGFASRELVERGAPWFPGELVPSGISGENRIDWARGELLSVAHAAHMLGADLIHAPANLGPMRSRIPVVVTIHDLLPFHHPELVPGRHASVLRWMNRRAAAAARRVITVSEASRLDIERYLAVGADRIDVVPLAGGARDESGVAETIARRDDLLLSIGNRMPHKNFTNLLEALALIEPDRRPHLIITGSHGDDPLHADVARLDLGGSVELRGWLDMHELEQLYASATAFVFPTRFEGFGLPPLEAMARGCPVIASDLPVIREVCGDAARYVDSRSPGAITRAIVDVLADPVERKRMSRRGLDRAAEFSWRRTAAGTLQSFDRALEAS